MTLIVNRSSLIHLNKENIRSGLFHEWSEFDVNCTLLFSFVIYNQPSYIQSVLKYALCSLPQHIYTLSVSESQIFYSTTYVQIAYVEAVKCSIPTTYVQNYLLLHLRCQSWNPHLTIDAIIRTGQVYFISADLFSIDSKFFFLFGCCLYSTDIMYCSLVSVQQSNLVMVKNKMNRKKYHKVETVAKSNYKKAKSIL